MANGQQRAEENYQRFVEWMAAKADKDYRKLECRGVINRTIIAAECGFAKSVLSQNPRVKEALIALEKGLRDRHVLPPSNSKQSRAVAPVSRGGERVIAVAHAEQLRSLETANAALLKENEELTRNLKKFTILQQALMMTGRIPR